MGSRLIFFLPIHTSNMSRINNTPYIEDPTLKGHIMTTLLALIVAPFAILGIMLIIGELFGKKKQWN